MCIQNKHQTLIEIRLSKIEIEYIKNTSEVRLKMIHGIRVSDILIKIKKQLEGK
jgi:hypothetical protein